MGKAVMISIKPKWVELIASGEKTVEVRKTRPNLDTPFKTYIYCTKPSFEHEDFFVIDAGTEHCRSFYGGGKVIGEFVCGKIDLYYKYTTEFTWLSRFSCVSIDDLVDYAEGYPKLYGWCITNLQMYDKPNELSEFNRYVGFLQSDKITKAPQSWMYVEELT